MQNCQMWSVSGASTVYLQLLICACKKILEQKNIVLFLGKKWELEMFADGDFHLCVFSNKT